MHEAIPMMALPDWLAKLTAESMLRDPFPLADVLEDSCYYAGAGHDGAPVRLFGGNVHSFVYSNCTVRRGEVIEKLHGTRTGFPGFSIVGLRDIAEHELMQHGWPFCDAQLEQWLWANDDRMRVDWFIRDRRFVPFVLWIVFERNSTSDLATRPFRFSLLYIGGESVATYQGLYNANGFLPRILYLIMNGHGGNWTVFDDPDRIFARLVGSHPRGIPEWLIANGITAVDDGRLLAPNAPAADRASPWPRLYSGGAKALIDAVGLFAVWQRVADCGHEFPQAVFARAEMRC